MGITLDWLIEEKVIFGHYFDVIASDELSNAMDDIVDMIEGSSAPLVHTLIDNTKLDDYPKNIRVLRDSTRQLLAHPRYGWLVVYGQNDKLTQFFVQVATSMFKVRFRMFKTRGEAIEFLQYVDTTLQGTLD